MAQTKRRLSILAFFCMLAMLATVVAEGLPATRGNNPLVPQASADAPPGSDTEDDGNASRPQFYKQGETQSLPAGFFTAEFSVELRHPDNWEIFYCVATAAGNTARSGDTTMTNVEFGHPRMRRHDGGVNPVTYTSGEGPVFNAAGEVTNCQLDPLAKRYDGAIRVSGGVDAFTIATVARNPATGAFSDIRVRTWINAVPNTAGDAGNRSTTGRGKAFHTDMIIVSLYSDARGIFAHDGGIFSAGANRDEWIEAYVALNPGRTEAQIRAEMDSYLTQGNYPPTLPANFTKRGRGAAERMAYLEMFTAQGERIVNQRVGIRVKGGWSRGTFVNEQKTFEIYARNAYGDSGTVLYPIFGQQNSISGDGNLLHRYSRFRVRNGGSDREQTYMRDELAQDLARLSGFPAPQNHVPGVVYLNGGYYGMVWLKSPRTEEHWSRIYGGDESRFEIIGSNEMGSAACGSASCGRPLNDGSSSNFTRPSDGTTVLHPGLCTDSRQCSRADCRDYWSGFNEGCSANNCKGVNSWNEVKKIATGLDNPSATRVRELTSWALTDNSKFQQFCELVDIDNLLHYYALQTFGANCDWPANNIEMWRYFPTEEEKAAIARGELSHYLDGRWRFVAQDFEFGYGLFQNGSPTANANHETSNTIHALINRTGTESAPPGERATMNAEVPPGSGQWSEVSADRYHFNARKDTFIIPALMQRDDMKAKFANTLSDLINNSHSYTVSEHVYNTLRWKIEQEHRRMMGQGFPGRGATHNDEAWDSARQRNEDDTIRIAELPRGGASTPGSLGFDNYPLPGLIFDGNLVDGGHIHLQNFLRNRATNVKSHISTTLGLSSTSTVTLSIANPGYSQGGSAILNTLPIGMLESHAMDGTYTPPSYSSSADPRLRTSVTGEYYFSGGVEVPIYANPWPGYRVKSVTGATHAPLPSQPNRWVVTSGGTVTVEFEKDPEYSTLTIAAVQAAVPNGDWFEIRNNTNAPISTRGLFVVDNANNNMSNNRFDLPSAIIRPGQSLFVRCRSNSTDRALKNMTTGFNLSFGDRLRLVDAITGQNVERVEVTLMDASEIQHRQADGTFSVAGLSEWRTWNSRSGVGQQNQ